MSFSNETLLLLFDWFIGEIVNYFSEVWGNNIGCNIAKLHTDVCKHILGVKKSTNAAYLYAELGCVPLVHYRMFNIINFWKNVLIIDNCIIRHCYEVMCINCEEHSYKNWVFDVKKILIDLGFYYISTNQIK